MRLICCSPSAKGVMPIGAEARTAPVAVSWIARTGRVLSKVLSAGRPSSCLQAADAQGAHRYTQGDLPKCALLHTAVCCSDSTQCQLPT